MSEEVPPNMSPALALVAATLAAVAAEPNVVDTTLRDEARGKDLEVRVVHPASGDHLPLILFSHGAGGSRRGVTEIGRVWAAHGYVVVAPTHADSGALGRRPAEPAKARGSGAGAPAPVDLEGRVRDLVFLLDHVDLLEQKVPALKGRIDRAATGVAGHSMGATTAQLLAGARARGTADLTDPRPLAFVALSPQGENDQLSADAWRGIKRPMMILSGTQDRGAGGRPPDWRKESFENSAPGDKYLVFIAGAMHMSFTGRLAGPDYERIARRMERRAERRPELPAPHLDAEQQRAAWDAIGSSSVLFWDAYLRRDTRARSALASLGETLAGRAEVESR
jgi:predicted dienelactone hydrolase